MTTFGPLFVPEEVRAAVSDDAWLAAMLDAERALAVASARVGVVPADAAAAIALACDPASFAVDEIAAAGRAVANPAAPLVDALRARVGGEAARWVHFGATSQDVVDTAAVLVAREATKHVVDSLDGAAAACARLAEEHRDTPAAGRTLLQQAVPTTFGAKAAGWLTGLLDARDVLVSLRLPAQLGGAAGTLAAFGGRGVEVLEAYAAELDLDAPTLPWHARRGPLGALAARLDAAAVACAKIGLDVVLLAQTEVGEVAEAAGGGSSTMPHKRNPAQASLARACARLVHANAGVLTGGEYEHERAAGAWQAEWTALTETLAHTAGAAAAIAACLDGLEVFPERMRANMTPHVYSERDRLGLGDDADYLGSAGVFVDRALARYREGA
ncbi:MAG TPA: lyase family protein [Gaiellaceae bacterium]|nr:lyase family protein [Gaiellaceae bacterium]